MRSKDIQPILQDWDYDPNQVKARLIIGDDGRRKVQMRIELGVIQMELFGRPDGKRPGNYESLLDLHLARLEKHRRLHGGDAGFSLNEEECYALQQESLQYYHRYLSLFHLGEFEGVIQDTEHNLRLFDLIHQYAEDERLRWLLENYRPYVLRMNTLARAEIEVQRRNYGRALEYIQEGMERIEAFFRQHGREDLIEDSRELEILRERAEQIRAHRPRSREEELERLLKEAIAAEDYERAALLRDELRAARGLQGERESF
jgi:hypothetical protein